MTFDWTTFAFQLFNVLVLLAILRHLLFRPTAAIIARRRQETQRVLDEAAAARAAAEAAAARARAEAERLASERAAILARAAEEAEAQRQALIAKARAEAAQIVDEGRAALAREADRNAARMVAQIRDLAMAVARRALKAQPASPEGYLARLAEALAQMDERSRAALLRGRNLTLVAAAELPEPVLRKARDLLAGFGAEASFRVDPDILAGLELHSDSGALLNSLAHDLDLLSKAMQDDRSAS